MAGGDEHVARLGPARDLVRGRLGGAARPDPDHGHRVEPEPERVRDADDLEDVVAAETRVAGADGGLGDADLRRDPPEGVAPVRLERLDDLRVEGVDPAGTGDRAPPLAARRPDLGAQCEAIPTTPCAMRQSTTTRPREAPAEDGGSWGNQGELPHVASSRTWSGA